MELNNQQKDRIRKSILDKRFDLNLEIEILMQQGFNEEDAAYLVLQEKDIVRQELFNQVLKNEKEEDYTNIGIFILFLISLIGPLFGINSFVWYLVACLFAGGLGYWAFKKNPFAGLAGFVSFVLIFPFFYDLYFSGRSTVIRIEFLIPMVLSAIPSFIIGILVSKFYNFNKS